MLKNKTLITAAISLFALNANAGIVETGTCNSAKTCKYELDDSGNLRIYGTGEIEAYRHPLNDRSDIKTMVIEKGITAIGDNAFAKLHKLERVSISKTVTSIGSDAFYQMGSLKTITIPKSVKSIASYAFIYTTITDMTIEGYDVDIGENSPIGHQLFYGNMNINVVPGSETEKRLKKLYNTPYAKFHAYIPPKRTSYTIEEAMDHVNHTNNNKIIFTFK